MADGHRPRGCCHGGRCLRCPLVSRYSPGNPEAVLLFPESTRTLASAPQVVFARELAKPACSLSWGPGMSDPEQMYLLATGDEPAVPWEAPLPGSAPEVCTCVLAQRLTAAFHRPQSGHAASQRLAGTRRTLTAVATLSDAAEPRREHGGTAAMGLLCEIFVSRADRHPVGWTGQCSSRTWLPRAVN